MATLDDTLRSQIGNAYASGDYTTANNLVTQNNISQQDLQSSFNISNADLNTATAAGRITAYNQPQTTSPTPSGVTSSTPPSQNTIQSATPTSATPSLRDTFGQLYQNKDYAGLQQTINQNGLTSDWAKQNYSLSDSDLNYAKSLGINFAGAPAAPTTTPATSADSGGTPDWLTKMNDPNWQRDQLSQGNGALGYRDPSTGNLILPHYSGSSDSGMPTADGYRVLDGGKQTGTGMQTYRVLDANGKDTGKTEQMGYVSDWFTNIMPYVIGAAATFGIGSTIAGVAGAAGAAGAGASTDAMTAAAASDAGGGSLGGAAPGLSQSAGLSATPGVTMGADGSTTFGAVDGSLTHAADGLVPGTGLQAPLNTGLTTNMTGPLTGAPGLSATPGAIPPLNAAGDIGSLATTTGAAGLTAPTGALNPFSLSDPAMGSGSSLGPAATSGMTALSTGLSVPSVPSTIPGVTTPGVTTPTGTTPTGITPSTAANGLGSLISGLTGIATAVQNGNAQRAAANNMLDWLKSQQAKIDNLYQPGSPEYNLLMQQMAAKDAAAGRNSQYGVRSVDLAAKIAQIKAQYTAQLTAGIAGNMSTAFNQSANSNTGLDAILGNLTKPNSSGNSTLSSIIGQFT